jgi:hypothetical protein
MAWIFVHGVQAIVGIQAQYAAEIARGDIAARIAVQQQAAVGHRGQQVQSFHRPQPQHFMQRTIRPHPMQRIVVAFETRQRREPAVRVYGDIVNPVRILAQHAALAAHVHAHDAPALAGAGGHAFAQQDRGRLRRIDLHRLSPLHAAQRHAHAGAAIDRHAGQRTRRAQIQPAAIARPEQLVGFSAPHQQPRLAACSRQQHQAARLALFAQVGHVVAGRRQAYGCQPALFEESCARQLRCSRQRALGRDGGAQSGAGIHR